MAGASKGKGKGLDGGLDAAAMGLDAAALAAAMGLDAADASKGKGAGALAGASKGKGKGLDAAAMGLDAADASKGKGNGKGIDAAATGFDAMGRVAQVSGGVTGIVETGGSPTTAAAADNIDIVSVMGSTSSHVLPMTSWNELLVDANSFVDELLVNASYGPGPGSTPVSMSLVPRGPGPHHRAHGARPGPY